MSLIYNSKTPTDFCRLVYAMKSPNRICISQKQYVLESEIQFDKIFVIRQALSVPTVFTVLHSCIISPIGSYAMQASVIRYKVKIRHAKLVYGFYNRKFSSRKWRKRVCHSKCCFFYEFRCIAIRMLMNPSLTGIRKQRCQGANGL